MADDNILRVGAEFDVSNIISGAQAASTAFEGMGAKIAATSTSVAAASTGIDKLAASLKAQGLSSAEVSSVLVNQGLSAKEAAEATANLDIETDATIGPTTALTAAIDAQAAAHQRLVVAQNTSRAGMGAFGTSASEARVVLGGLEGSTGMMASGFARLAGQSATLAPLIQAAFPIFGVVAFIAIMDAATAEINKGIDALTGWDAAAKKAFNEAAQANLEQIDKNIESQAKLRDVNEIGLAAEAKHEVTIKNLTSEQQDWNNALTSTTRQITAVETKITHLKSLSEQAIVFGLSLGDMSKLDDDVTLAEAQLARLQKQQKEQLEKVQSTGVAIAVEKPTAAADQAKAAIDAEAAKAAGVRTIQEAELAYAESVTKREYQDYRITLEQELSELRTEESNKVQIIRDSVAAQRTELEQRHKTTGEDIGPKLTALNAQAEAEETAHQSRMDQIDADGTRERNRIEQDAALHRIEVDRQIATAYDEQSEHKAEIAYRAATTVSTVESTGVEYTHARTQAIRDQISAIQQEQTVLDKGVKAPGGELADPAMASKYAENVAKITTLSQQMETVVTETTEETTRRVRELQSQQLDTELSTMEEQARVTEDTAKRQDEAVKTSFEDRSISARRYLETVQANSSAEYEAQISSITREIQLVTQAGDARVLTEEQVAKRLEELWKQEQQAHDRMLQQDQQAVDLAAKREQASIQKLAQQWGQDWTRMANEVLQGRLKIQQALTQMAAQMEIQLIDKGIKMAVTKTATSLLELLAKHVSFQSLLEAIDSAAGIKQITKAAATSTAVSAKTAASDVAEVTSYAAVAEAAAAAAAAPAGPEASAAAAAAEAAIFAPLIGQAATTAEKGGIMPADMPLFAHAKEMILPAHISTAVQGAVPAMANFNEAMAGGFGAAVSNISNTATSSSESKSVRTGPIRVTNNFPSTGSMTPDDVIAHVNRGIRTGLIKVGL